MKKRVVSIAIPLVILRLIIAALPETTIYYVSQSGTGDGSTVGTPASLADFNAGIAPFDMLDGTTIYFLGTITTTINPADGGTEEARVILRGDYSGQECVIAGGGSVDIGIDIEDDDFITVVQFAIQDTTAYAISIGSGALDAIIEDCTIDQTAGRGIASQSSVTITGNTLTATGGIESVYSLLGDTGSTATIANNTFNFNHAGPGLFIRGYGTHIITDKRLRDGLGRLRDRQRGRSHHIQRQ